MGTPHTDIYAWSKLVEDYVRQVHDDSALVVSIIAVIVSLLALLASVCVFYKKHRQTVYSYLATVWNEVLDLAHENPKYLDVTVTEDYVNMMSPYEQHRYDTYCYKAWGHVEDIIVKGFHSDAQFEPVVHWIACHHYAWLQRNPVFFKLESFWKVIEQARNSPHLMFRCREIPRKDGDIDWDIVANDYHKYILSPFAPEMVAHECGRIRNRLLAHLLEFPSEDLLLMRVADFGCGPGNLIPHIAGRVRTLWAIDKSQRSLEIAEEIGNAHGVTLRCECADIRSLRLQQRFDLIISSNAILESSRDDNVELIRAIRRHLAPAGRLLAILPSFDTVQHLRNLWRRHYIQLLKNEKHADRIVAAFELAKKYDPQNCAYADDGRTTQCYHTPDTISREFSACGMRVTYGPEKVYYPWCLARRFDYGYFPAPENEEIWDWFVVAERSGEKAKAEDQT